MDEARSPSPLSASEQARIRRERRQAKVRGAGTDRLSKITGTQRIGSDSASSTPPPVAATPPPREDNSTPDPPEIDISAHHYDPAAQRRQRAAVENMFAEGSPMNSPPQASDELRQMMMMENMFRQQQQQQQQQPERLGGMGATDDPIMALLQQMGGMPGGSGGMPGMPPGMEQMMRGMPGMGNAEEIKTVEDRWAPWWKVLHALCTTFLALWVLRSTGWNFNGSELQRVESGNVAMADKPQLFWYFATMELVLQSSRFLLEKGRPPQGFILTSIGEFLPPPFGTVFKTLARYSVIWTTISADIGVLVFCLGIASWWNS